MFRIRIDITNDLNSDEVLEVVRPDSYVVVRHELPHGNPHYHLYVKFDNEMKEPALRQRFKRKFSYLKSTDYSIKNCDATRVNEYVQYMFNTKHGNKWEFIDSRNFDNQLINDLKEAAKKISTDYESVRKKPKGITVWDIAVEVENEFNTINTTQYDGTLMHTGSGRAEDFLEDSAREKLMIKIYTDLAIKIMRKHKKGLDEFLIRKVISTAMSSHEAGKQLLVRKMFKNFCHLI